MNKVVNERRRSCRRDLRIRVRLYRKTGRRYQYAHLHDINQTGLYLITKQKLALNEKIELEIPDDSNRGAIKIGARVTRRGRHRSWGLFSYGCRILHTGRIRYPDSSSDRRKDRSFSQ